MLVFICPNLIVFFNNSPSLYCMCVNAYIIGPSLDLLVKAVLVLIPEGRVAHQQDV